MCLLHFKFKSNTTIIIIISSTTTTTTTAINIIAIFFALSNDKPSEF
jgi:hypothetical protein